MPLSPSQTRELLRELDHLPKKKLGQNFLIDGNIVRMSIELAGLRAGDAVVEVGPGLGTLSRALLASGAELWAVERDAALAAHLRDKLAASSERFHLIEGDCLDQPLAGLPPDRADAFKIVANLPYAVSTPWMDAVLSGPLPRRMVLMLQKEAAERYVAPHGGKAFGAISIFLQSAYSVARIHKVAASCFYPAPQVDSVLIRLDRRPNPVVFSAALREPIRAIFTQRRKQLGALCRQSGHTGLVAWFDSETKAGLAATARPEEVPPESWMRLATGGVPPFAGL